jgi:hypothetical protein
MHDPAFVCELETGAHLKEEFERVRETSQPPIANPILERTPGHKLEEQARSGEVTHEPALHDVWMCAQVDPYLRLLDEASAGGRRGLLVDERRLHGEVDVPNDVVDAEHAAHPALADDLEDLIAVIDDIARLPFRTSNSPVDRGRSLGAFERFDQLECARVPELHLQASTGRCVRVDVPAVGG